MDTEAPSLTEELKRKREEAAQKVAEFSQLPDRAKPMAHRTTAIIHMAALGFTKKEIARQMNVSEGRIYAILSAQSAKKEVERIQNEFFFKDPQKMFQAMVPKAARTVNRLLNRKEKGSVQLGAANTIFDRALGKAVQPVDVGGSAIKELLMALDKTKNGPAPGATNEPIDAEFRQIEPEKPKDDLDAWLDENM